jgi:Tetracyclin repressor-like, C-terminal domain
MADVPARDSLRDDLAGILNRIRAAFAATGGASFHLIVAEAGGNCRALADDRIFRPARAAIIGALERAVERGEIHGDLVTPGVADIGPALLRSHALDGTVPSESLVSGIVDEVLLPLLVHYVP